MSDRRKLPMVLVLIALLFAGASLAQIKIQKDGLPTATLPEGAKGKEGALGKVAPGPEPWFTVFGTGEVVGYIEPCG